MGTLAVANLDLLQAVSYRRCKEEEEEAEWVMARAFSFIQANLQHSIAASGIFTRTVGIKGIDMALVQEPWYYKDCIKGFNIPGYTLYCARAKERPRAYILVRA